MTHFILFIANILLCQEYNLSNKITNFFMELTKQSLFAIQIFAQPLEKNFSSIEEEFKRINATINTLRQQNQSFKIFKSKLQKLIDESHFTGYLPKPSIPNQSVVEVDQQALKNQNEQNALGDMISNESVFHEMDDHQDYVRIQKTMSETVLGMDQPNIDSILPGFFNDPEQQFRMKKKSIIPKQPNNAKVEQSSAFGKEKIIKNVNSNNKNSQQTSGNSPFTQQINLIREKLQNLEMNDNCFKEQIQLLERENDKFRKILGIKKNTSKDKAETLINSSQNTSRDSKAKKEESPFMKNQMPSPSRTHPQQEQESKQEEPLELQSFKELREDVQKIKQYLNGKVKSIDSNLFDINTKIHGITRQIDLMERTLDSHKEDIQYLERTSNQTKLNSTELNDKSFRNKRTKKALQGVQQNDKGEQNKEKSRSDVEQNILNLLDQMERLKSEYQEIMFGKQQEEGENTEGEIDPQIMQKRKKLALKFNLNGSDQKTRKELAICKRDLKKLRDEFDNLMTGVNSGTHETKTLIIKPNQTKEDWKSLSTKISKLRQELVSQVKDLESRITANNELSVILNGFEVGIEECKILIKKKLDIVDFEKTVKRIDSRLNNFIRQTFEKEYTNEQDALIAKKPWFCLSCDVELKTYGNKTSKTISPIHQDSFGDKFVGKKVNPELHMVRRNQSSKLPSLGV